MEAKRIETFEEFIAKCVEKCVTESTQPVDSLWYRKTDNYSFVAGIINDSGSSIEVRGKIIDDYYEIKEITGENLHTSSLLTAIIADSVRDDLSFAESEDGGVWYRRVNDNFVAGVYDIIAYGELYGTRNYKVKKVIGSNLDLKAYLVSADIGCSIKTKRKHKNNRSMGL